MSLELLVADIQPGLSYRTFCRAAELAPVCDTVPTGLRALDELLDGGLLAGASHCISGEEISGAASIFYRAVAGAQAQGVPVLYLEMGPVLDRPQAAAAGIELGRLLLLSGASLEQATILIRSLARDGLPCLAAIDHPPALPLVQHQEMPRDASLTLLAHSPISLPEMQVTLECQRQDWRIERGDVVGFISELRLTNHPRLPYRQVRACFDIPSREACTARW